MIENYAALGKCTSATQNKISAIKQICDTLNMQISVLKEDLKDDGVSEIVTRLESESGFNVDELFHQIRQRIQEIENSLAIIIERDASKDPERALISLDNSVPLLYSQVLVRNFVISQIIQRIDSATNIVKSNLASIRSLMQYRAKYGCNPIGRPEDATSESDLVVLTNDIVYLQRSLQFAPQILWELGQLKTSVL